MYFNLRVLLGFYHNMIAVGYIGFNFTMLFKKCPSSFLRYDLQFDDIENAYGDFLFLTFFSSFCIG